MEWSGMRGSASGSIIPSGGCDFLEIGFAVRLHYAHGLRIAIARNRFGAVHLGAMHAGDLEFGVCLPCVVFRRSG